MMKSAKWLTGLLTAGVLASGAMPAWADTDTVDGVAWSYSVADGAATVTGAEPAEGTLAIPAELGECPVTGIASNAFDGCVGVTDVVVPGTVTNIGRYAFHKCTGLLSVTIPASVKGIGFHAFSQCTGLEAVHIDDLAAWCGISFGNAYANPVEYAGRLHLGGEEVAELRIPGSVGRIGNYAFINCRGLTNVVIPGGVKTIGTSSFSGCRGLTSLVIPGSVERIGSYAFADCAGVAAVEIPAGVESIGIGAFDSCSALAGIGVASGNAAYESEEGVLFQKGKEVLMQFPGGKSGTYAIPEGVGGIEDYAFSGCKGLAEVVIPGSVGRIGSYAFADCAGLAALAMGSGVTRIGNYAFQNCTGLATMDLPAGLEDIGNGAFYRCDGLASATIPGTVTNIGRYAFAYCRGLRELEIPESVESVGARAFHASGLKALYVPGAWEGTEMLEEAGVPEGCEVWYRARPGEETVDGVAWRYLVADGCATVTGAEPAEGTLAVPAELGGCPVTGIAAGAFCGCGGLMAVTIPAGVESVGDSAFADCGGLARVNAPEEWEGTGMLEGAGLGSMLAVVYGEAPEGEADEPGKVSFEPGAGAWPEIGEEGVDVSMEAGPGAAIYYTLDGSRPVCTNAAGEVLWSATAVKYEGPVRAANGRDDGEGAISRIMTGRNQNDAYDPWFAPAEAPRTIPVLRAAAVGPDGRVGEVATASYLLGDMAGRYGKTPVFSLCAEWADLFDNVNGPGIYRHPTADLKNKVPNAHVEFIEGGSRRFAKWCELRGHGGTTLGRPKKSLRLTGWEGYAASGKGKKESFDWPFFADKSRRKHSTIVLRMGGNDWNRALLRDRLAQEIGADEEVDVEEGAVCVVFLNGVYWGVHEIRERFDSKWFEEWRGIGKKSGFSVLEYGDQLDYPQVNEGLGEDDEARTSAAYADFWTILRQLEAWDGDLSDEGRWAWFTNRVNPDSLAAHFASSLFVGNSDWPWNNQRWWRAWPDGAAGASVDRSRPRNDGRWNWTFHDMDFAFALPFEYVPDWWNGLFSAHDPYAGIHPGEGPYVGTWVPDASRAFRAAMSNEGFRNRFLARVYLRLATDWTPAACAAALERVAGEFQAAGMDENGARWRQPQTAADWERQVDSIRRYLRGRPEAFAWHTRKRYGLGAERTVVLGTEGDGAGNVRVAGRALDGDDLPLRGGFPRNLPIELEAVPARGSAFAGWFAAPGLLPEEAEARAEDCAANYAGGNGAFPAASLGRGWGEWVREGGTAFTGTSAMPIHGRSENGQSFGVRAGGGEAGAVRRELADGAVLAVGEEMSVDVAFGLSGGNGGAGLAFVTAGGAEEPVRLALVTDEADGEAYRVTVDGAESIAENFPHLVGTPIRAVLVRTGGTAYELRLERGGEVFGTDIQVSGEITGVRLWKNPYGYAEAKYDFWFDNLRVGAAAAGTEAEPLETAVLRSVAFYETGSALSRWERNVSGIAEATATNHALSNIGTPAFLLRAQSGGSASLQRQFGFALTNGYELSFDFQNNAIDGEGHSAGAVFWAGEGESFEFVAEAGGANYLLRMAGEEDVDTGVAVVRTGLRVAVAPREGGGVDVSVGGRTFALDAAPGIDGIGFFNRGCGLGPECPVYFNHVAVRCEPGAALPEPGREPDFFETGNDIGNWWFESSGGTNDGWAGYGSEDSDILGAAAFFLYAGGPVKEDGKPYSAARRMFPDDIELGAGAVLSFRFAHGSIGDESSTGIGNVGWELMGADYRSMSYFIATRDDVFYKWEGIALSAPKTPGTPHDVELRFSSDTNFDLYLDGVLLAGDVAVRAPVRGIRFWNSKAGSGAGRNFLFNEIAVYLPAGGEQAASRRATPRGDGETLLSKDRVWTLVPDNDIAVVARFVPAAADGIDAWAAERGIDDPWTTDPDTGRSYAEEYLLETNGVASLHGVEGNAYSLHFTPGEHGVEADIEVAESLLPGGKWRKPSPGELVSDESGRRFAVAASNAPSPFFIRLRLRPAD